MIDYQDNIYRDLQWYNRKNLMKLLPNMYFIINKKMLIDLQRIPFQVNYNIDVNIK